MFRLIGDVLGLRRRRGGNNNDASRRSNGFDRHETEPQRLPSLLESKMGKQVKKDYGIRELEAIDRGTFGQIYRIKTSKKATKPCTVLKVLTAKDSSLQECDLMCAEARNEAEIVESLSGHPNIVKLFKHQAYANPLQPHLDGYYTMQFELCEKSLYKFIVEHTRIRSLLDGSVTENLFYQIGSAVAFMHERRFAHHDIKSHNIMIVDDSVQRKDLQFKLIDFGTARSYPSEWPIEDTEDRVYTGTEWFMCPEKLAWHPRRTTPAVPYNPYLADVFALGLTCIECALGFERESLVDPHYNTRDASLIRMLVKLRRLNYLSDHVRSGIARMLHRYEELRPQMHEIMKPE